MKKLITSLLAVSVLLCAQVSAQMTTFRFTYDVGAFDIAGGMVETPTGDFVIAGLNNSFGPYYGNAVKIDAAGNTLWAKSYTAGFASNFSDIKNVSTGGYIITGSSTSGGGGAILIRIDANGNVLWSNRYQLPNHPTGNASNEYGSSVIETSDGGFLVGGGVDYFWDGVSASTVDTTSAMGFKVDASGTLLWSRVWTITTANPDEHYINDVAESADGYFFVGQSSEGSGTLSDGDYPSNALLIKTNTAGTLTYIRRWGAGNTSSQGINAALRLSTGNILLGGFDDLHGFIISISGTGAGTPTVIFNRRLNGSIFGNIYLVQDIMENSDGNYSVIGTQLAFLSVALNTMIVKINSSTGALIFGRSYAPIGLSAILPEGGLCSDQGYYVAMTDQQMTGFNYNVIRTNTVGQTNDPASGCPGTSLSPALGTITVTFSTPASSNYNLATTSAFTPVVNNLTPVRTQHCFNAPAPLSATSSSTNVTCFGQCTGSATVVASGGTSPYTYAWAPSGGTAATASSLCAGTYTCTITDNVGATTTASFNITQPATAVSATQSQTNLTCNAVCNGSASVSASGGTPGYTYSWAPSGGTGASASSLCAGNYTCTITDANGCATTRSFAITQPPAIAVAPASQTNISCNGGSNGAASVTASGGTGGLTYDWTPGNPAGDGTNSVTGLSTGSWTCTVTDANGCTSTQTFNITQPAVLAASAASQGNISCNGGSNGAASVSVSGGTAAYTYDWTPGNPAGDGTNSVTGLSVGSWTCTVTDANGCTTTQTFNITQPSALTASAASQTNVSCNSAATGAASVSVSGGTAAYTYDWTPGNPTGDGTSSVTGLTAGSWTCTVTDANGCTTTQTFNITQPSSALSATPSQVNVSCNAGCNGSATVAASGGTSPYTYAWTPSGGTGATASALCAGNYTCTITDANSCTTTQAFSITEPAALTASASTTPTGCSASTGTATATPTGGVGPYTYSWAPSGGTSATASNLAAGNYTCTVTDANGCTTTANASVSSSSGPALSVQSSGDVTCNGAANGSATISATGNGPFTYSWSPSGGTAATATNLGPNTYTCTVIDVNGCSSVETVVITEPTAITASTTTTPATCGSTDGSATVTASGGTGALTYSWAPSGGTGATENNIGSGNYTVTITDANGCTSTATANVTNTGGPGVSIQSSSDVSCFGDATGSATVNATGNGPFTYAWNPSGGTAATESGLAAGTYTCTITDINGCSSLQTVVITEPSGALVSSPTSTPATCGNNNGTADAVAGGGTGPYTYLWSNSQTTSTISGLAGGTYSVTVTDANGCTTTATVTVANNGAPVVSLAASADPTCFGLTNGSASVSASGGSPPYTYAWSPTGGNTATATGLAAGTYTVTVTGSDGCVQTQTVTLTQPSAVTLTGSSASENCGNGDGSAAVAANGGTPGYTYVWSTGGTSDTIGNLAAGSYSVTVTDANGCASVTTVIVSNTGTAIADAGTAVTITQGQSTMLNGTGGGTYSWSPPDGLSCTNCATPVASPSVTTTYTLTVTDSLGCTATDTVTVFVDIACGTLFLPTGFSPNGDNENDVLYVRGNCIEFLDLQVFNRWGEVVFSTTDPALGWDGTWRGKECEAAVFTYVLRATLLDGTQIDKQGSITLVK